MNDIIKIAGSLTAADKNFITNAANISALIFDKIDRLNWAGVYLKDGDELLLGPFQGRTACLRIPPGKGVCGTAMQQARTLLVDNVHDFPGHIACDSASESEIVVPLIYHEQVYGVLDIDSPEQSRFGSEERQIFEAITRILTENSDIEALKNYYRM